MTSSLSDLDLSKLNNAADDKTTRKLLMLIEGTYGIGVKASIAKYGYTEQRYYQLLNVFKKEGVQALVDQKRGPKTNRVRSKKLIGQIGKAEHPRDRVPGSIAAALGVGNGAVFALVSVHVPPERVGSVTGLVGAAGGLGGFLPPIVMGLVREATGDYAIGLMLLSTVAFAGMVHTWWRFIILERADLAGDPRG